MRRLTAALALAFVVSASPTWAQTAPTRLGPTEAVLRVEAPEVTLCVECPAQAATFRATILDKAGPLTFTQPRVVSASTSGPFVTDLAARFAAAWKPQTDGTYDLVVTVSPALRTPATYDLVLDYAFAERPAAPRGTVKLTVPAAVLAVPAKLFASRTVWWPAPASSSLMPLIVRETGGRADARLRLESDGFVHEDEAVTGMVVAGPEPAGPGAPTGAAVAAVPPPAFPLALGGSREVPYHLAGDFPLGLTTGSVRLEAAELGKTVAIPVEVRSALSPLHLALGIGLGVCLSYYLKVRLHERRTLSEARVAAGTLREQVKRERTQIEDETFRGETQAAFDGLGAAMRATDPAAMETARLALDKAWRTARAAYATRRRDYRDALAAWQQTTSVGAATPPTIRPILQQAQTEAARTSELEAAGNVAGAAAKLEAVRRAAAEAVRAAGRDWQVASRGFFDALLNARSGVSNDILDPLRSAVTDWRDAIPLLPLDERPNPDSVGPMVSRLANEYFSAERALRQLPADLRREFALVKPALVTAGVGPALLDAVVSRRADVERVVTQAIDDPGTAATGIAAVLDALHQAWLDAFVVAASATDQKDALQKALDARNYRGAADVVAGRILGDPRDDDAPGAGAPGPLASPTVPAPPFASPAGAAPPLDPTDPYTVILIDATDDVWRAKRLQSAIIFVMFVAWAWSTATAGFDGTVPGLLAATFSAFGLDLGLDALRSKVTGKLFA